MAVIPVSEPADLAIGGVPVSELAATYGTPLHLIDLDELELEIDRFARSFGARGITVGYAGKAFLCIALAEHLAATALRLDVCSLGELLTAERGGMPRERLYFHGCGKTYEELRAIADGRVAFNVIDNCEELEALAAIAAGGASVDVMLRINTGIEAHTHEYVRTTGENSKFGIPLANVDAVLARLRDLQQLRLIGLHSHIGSSITEIAPFVENVELLVRLADRARELGHPIVELIAGGGIGVEERPSDSRPVDFDALAQALLGAAAGTTYRLAIEPGRALIARSGSTVYTVKSRKMQGERAFVIVDGGMADNPRPLIYGSYHHVQVVHSRAARAAVATTLCGRSCENDKLGDFELPPDLAAGDLLAMRTTGAYTYSMASNYNRFGRPPVVFVRDGSHRRVIRAERPEDVLRNDLG